MRQAEPHSRKRTPFTGLRARKDDLRRLTKCFKADVTYEDRDEINTKLKIHSYSNCVSENVHEACPRTSPSDK